MSKLLITFGIILFFFVSPLNSKAGRSPDLSKFGNSWEEYDSSLFYRLQSINDILAYSDSAIGIHARQTLPYCEWLTATIIKRFYHGYSYYSLDDNWIAWLAGVLVWDHLHAIVLPDDLLKQPMAACSQQAIVLKECFKRIGIDYREVDLKGHFVLEGKVEGQWFLFDPNLEPQFMRGRKSLDTLLKSGELYLVYKDRLPAKRINTVFANPVYRQVNASIAPNATLFQQVTCFLSFSLPLMLPLGLLLFLVVRMRAKKDRKPEGVRFVDVKKTVGKVEEEERPFLVPGNRS